MPSRVNAPSTSFPAESESSAPTSSRAESRDLTCTTIILPTPERTPEPARNDRAIASERAYATREPHVGASLFRDLAEGVSPGHFAELEVRAELDAELAGGIKGRATVSREEDGSFTLVLDADGFLGASAGPHRHAGIALGAGTRMRFETAEGVADFLQALSKTGTLISADISTGGLVGVGAAITGDRREALDRVQHYVRANTLNVAVESGFRGEAAAHINDPGGHKLAEGRLAVALMGRAELDLEHHALRFSSLVEGAAEGEINIHELKSQLAGEGQVSASIDATFALTPAMEAQLKSGSVTPAMIAQAHIPKLELVVKAEVRSDLTFGGPNGAFSAELEGRVQLTSDELGGSLVDRMSWKGEFSVSAGGGIAAVDVGVAELKATARYGFTSEASGGYEHVLAEMKAHRDAANADLSAQLNEGISAARLRE